MFLPNKKVKKPLKNYVVSVDSVEQLTKIDFFSQLLDKEEEELEKEINISNWTFIYK